jgi:hypothetical protein
MIKKSELETKRVSELKEMASELGIDTEGLLKAEIIEALLAHNDADGSEVEEEPEVEELADVEESAEEVEESAELVEPEVVESGDEDLAAEEAVEEIEEAETAPAQPSTIKVLKKLHMMFKNEDKTKPIRQVRGKVKVLHETDKYLKVETFISGVGYISGYIFK